jgi:ubiquinone/menaquinone biosynthesis C-methylase UbiE
MGIYARKILPFMMDKMLGTPEFDGYRRRLLAPARGRVLEIGFGTGLNASHYPPTVERVVAVEPNDGATKRADARISRARVPIELRVAPGEELPADDASFDCVVTSLVLCSVTDLGRTLSEIRRVLKPGGRYLLFEHGLCDDPKVQKWQHRMNGFQKRVFGGCHLNRPIHRAVEESGFTFEAVENFYLKAGPRFGSFCTMGTAIPGAPLASIGRS